jgi:hypothetical protein
MVFAFRLEAQDGTPADPPMFSTAVPNWRAGDTVPLGKRVLRVVDVGAQLSASRARSGTGR